MKPGSTKDEDEIGTSKCEIQVGEWLSSGSALVVARDVHWRSPF